MEDRRTMLMIAGAAAVTFGGVYMLSAPARTMQAPAVMALPREGGPTRVALAQARTNALNASNEAPPLSEVEAHAADFGPDPFYPNCSAARAAGAAPLHAGDPGYRGPLDRDGDGIACEPYRP